VNPVERFIFSLLLTKTKSDGHTARLTQGPTKQL
jgi:hypothetical protein